MGLDLLEKCFDVSTVVLCPGRIGFQYPLQRVVECAEFVEASAPWGRRMRGLGRSDPFLDGVFLQPGTLCYMVQRELVAEVLSPDYSQEFHADHPGFSCSESE